MKSIQTPTIVLVFLLLKLCYVINAQTTPAERCVVAQNGFVCLNCGQMDSCFDSVLQNFTLSCSPGQICDSTLAEEQCQASTDIVSPICLCEISGCFTDPNDPAVYAQCHTIDTVATLVPQCLSGFQFNTDTCECDDMTNNCPVCGLYPADTSDCTSTYYSCPGFIEFSCLEDLCFDTTTCTCQDLSSECPACGRYPDPASVDGSGFCICGDGIDDTCGISCAAGFTFDSLSCSCLDTMPTSTDASMSSTTTVCPECGFIADSSDCTLYSECSQSEHIPLVCPPDFCFFSVDCVCERYPVCPPCGFIGDDLDCSLYYACTSDNSQLIPGSCPPNFCFNIDTCGCAAI